MRRNIQLLVVGVTALVLLCAAVPLAFLIRNAVGERADQSAKERANDVARTIRFTSTDESAIKNYLASLDSSSLLTSVRLPDGTVLGKAPPVSFEPLNRPRGNLFPVDTTTPAPAPTSGAASPTAASPTPGSGAPLTRVPGGPGGGNEVGFAGETAQLYSVASGQIAVSAVPGTAGTYLVRVYLSDSERLSGLYRWWGLLTLVSIALLLFGAAVAELFTRRIVRPLSDAADTANRLAAGDVDARAPVAGPPEIAAVGQALNALADRIDELIAEERETVADLSHRLRTPLTALRLDVEGLENQEESERVGLDVSAVERTLTAVIRAARRPQREGRIASADLRAVVSERADFWSALAEEQGRAGVLVLPDQPVPVRASAEDLSAALDALLENVIAHTPEGTPYTVALHPQADGGAVLEVSDEGPGLPEGAGVRGRSDRGSTGLGLDIARSAAEAGGGHLELGVTESGGARLRLRFVGAHTS